MKKFAFTLAEVLITLAIIGVVAALTIPSVITNYRKNLYVTQLKKEYNYITNGFREVIANNGVTKLTDTKLWTSMPTKNGYPFIDISDFASNPEFKEEFLKTFNVIQIYDGNTNKIPVGNGTVVYKLLNGKPSAYSMTSGVCLADGACFDFSFTKTTYNKNCGDHECESLKEFQTYHNTPTKYWQSMGDISMDINGFQKGPNQLGRDYFSFVIANDGSLYPSRGIDYAVGSGDTYENVIAGAGNNYWKASNNQYCNVPRGYDPYYDGVGCAARIIEEGWKMNY